MDLKELDYIVTVANEGSISRAAEKLFMAQSSLSQAVRLFEQDLGTPIFVRTARGVRPTSAGEAFIFHARQILQQYPSIRVVLDIHRDAIQKDNTLIQPVVEINGKESAQVMIISGCDDGTMNMPNYMQNYHFACRLQENMEGMYAGLTRPILFDYRHYNQDLTTGSLLLEIGTHGNTLEQAQYAGELVGKALAQTLLKLKKE